MTTRNYSRREFLDALLGRQAAQPQGGPAMPAEPDAPSAIARLQAQRDRDVRVIGNVLKTLRAREDGLIAAFESLERIGLIESQDWEPYMDEAIKAHNLESLTWPDD